VTLPSTDPSRRYDGPEFEEYCIAEKSYLLASRDRTACISCPLGTLCQAGFEEQAKRVMIGKNPSLTEDEIFTEEQLSPRQLLQGLSEGQIVFLTKHVPSLK
jgi:hypothetical protein